MKYLKTYENLSEPQIGDYVLANFKFDDIEWANYINQNIGELLKIKNDGIFKPYRVKYYVDDDAYKKFFEGDEEEEDLIKFENDKRYIIMKFDISDIKVFSPNKEDLEMLLASKKYNL